MVPVEVDGSISERHTSGSHRLISVLYAICTLRPLKWWRKACNSLYERLSHLQWCRSESHVEGIWGRQWLAWPDLMPHECRTGGAWVHYAPYEGGNRGHGMYQPYFFADSHWLTKFSGYVSSDCIAIGRQGKCHCGITMVHYCVVPCMVVSLMMTRCARNAFHLS